MKTNRVRQRAESNGTEDHTPLFSPAQVAAHRLAIDLGKIF